MLADGAQNLRQEQIKKAVRGTRTWIDDEPVYKNWAANSRSIFCLIGKAGCGKSTVLSEMLCGLHHEGGFRRLSEMLKERSAFGEVTRWR
jgi:ABC-type phosphate transport system ATPase subunit